ncbi:MAG: aminoacyl-tRNA hydrolase, partial [Pirellulaceae bacterium]
RPPADWEVTDFVLSRFGKSERETMDAAVKTAADAVEHWLVHGILSCMNRYNRDS